MKIFASLIAVAGLLVLASAAQAGLVATFDGSAGYSTLVAEYNAYRTFMGTPQDTITFEEFFPGGLNGAIGDYYLAGKGVKFANEAGAVVLREGMYDMYGWRQEHVTGYDGSYMPNGTMLYDKPYNSNPASALTIIYFTTPVKQVGSFIGDSYVSASHTHTVSIYNSAGLLTTVNAAINAWDSGPNQTNAEGFWGVKCDTAEITKVTFLSPIQDYAVTTLDNIEWVVPEPATMAFLAFGGVGMLLRRRRR
jgi:hypothetical protein